jgi:MFS family permease
MKSLKHDPVSTILTIVVGFLVIFSLTDWKWLFYVALILGIIGVLSPYLTRIVDGWWMKLAKLLSFIVPNIVLTITYFVLLTPIAFLSRIFGTKDPLSIKNNRNSMFKERKQTFDKSYFKKPY